MHYTKTFDSDFMVSTSERLGTLFNIKPLSLNNDAGIKVRQEFSPDIGIDPDNFFHLQ